MTVRQMLCPANLSNNPNRPLQSIEYITIHTTGNRGPTADAHAHARYQYGGSGGRTASWHYTADACEVWRSFEDTRECWHTGTSRGNAESLGVEICVNSCEGFPKACENAASLTADLLARYHLSLERVVQHNFWSGKDCPAELRSGEWGVTWNDFIGLTEGKARPWRTPVSEDMPEAVALLREKGVILSPEYWLENAGKLAYVDRLILNMAGYIRDRASG
jgi:N-acetylmuramoyl-L-alanine amidase CwlA